MIKKTMRLLIFLLINFGALAIGGFFTKSGVTSQWYEDLHKATWTPPGWVFGFAWTTVMIGLSIYLTKAWVIIKNKKKLIILFSTQLILNVGWNPTFFYYQSILAGLIIISVLTLLVSYLHILYWPKMKANTLFILPYVIWLIIATSLNAYILFNN